MFTGPFEAITLCSNWSDAVFKLLVRSEAAVSVAGGNCTLTLYVRGTSVAATGAPGAGPRLTGGCVCAALEPVLLEGNVIGCCLVKAGLDDTLDAACVGAGEAVAAVVKLGSAGGNGVACEAGTPAAVATGVAGSIPEGLLLRVDTGESSGIDRDGTLTDP